MTHKKSMSKPLVSIVIPVYNQAQTISSSIHSAIAATSQYPESEIVVCDNHSTDGTSEAIQEFSHCIKIVRPPRHLTMAENWNYAIKNSSNPWILPVSGDDNLSPSSLTSLFSDRSLYQDAVLVFGATTRYELKTGKRSKYSVLSVPSFSNSRVLVRKLINAQLPSFGSFCFLRTAYEQIGGFDESFHLIQDWVLQLKLAQIGGFAKTNSSIVEKPMNQVRPDLDRKRLTLYIEDYSRMCLLVISIANSCKLQKSLIFEACVSLAKRCDKLINKVDVMPQNINICLQQMYCEIGKLSVKLSKPGLGQHFAIIKPFLRTLLRIFRF